MTLRSLEIFVSVVKHGNMTKAANDLHISQPTISQAITELEKEYGVQLFNRLSKKLYITDEGHQLFSYAQNVLSMVSEMEKDMKNLSINKTILLGATITVGKCVLVDIVKQFEEKHPNIKIIVTIDNTQTIENLLLSGKLDLGLVEGDIRSTELISKPVISDNMVLACSVNHELAQEQAVTIDELVSYPFIFREEGSGTREIFENELRKNGLNVKPKWTCHGSDSILEAVSANQGLTVLSSRLVEPYVICGKLCIIPIEKVQMERFISIVYHKDKYISKTLESFLSFIPQSQ